jgi:hypothetical protein
MVEQKKRGRFPPGVSYRQTPENHFIRLQGWCEQQGRQIPFTMTLGAER